MKKMIVSTLLAVADFFSPTANFANAFPPKKDGGSPTSGAKTTPPPAGKSAGGTEEPGKGTSPDPGTGKTFDFRKMLLELLGLPDDAQDQDVQQAYNSCMATEPGADAQQAKGQVDEAMKGKNDSDQQAAQAGTERDSALAQAHTAVQNLAKAQQANEVLVRRCERAEGAFANERNAHIQTMVNSAVATGKLSKAEGEAKVIELANAKTPEEFEKGSQLIANARQRYATKSSLDELGRTAAPGTASGEFLAMVNEAVKTDPKHDFAWHWAQCGKTEKGKSLLASMKQPEKSSSFEQRPAK